MLKIEVKRTVRDTEKAEPVREFSFQASTLVLLLAFLPVAILLLMPRPFNQTFNFNQAIGEKEKSHGQDRTQEHLQNV
ncbi:hypothetical protein C772_01700 [Bhargavaea cecembensis DSE10]|uniref:Uncharacterized protein n=1 Tax=Bhargavaea cecembensis DSE10 TaxID=1235279 RepID=M7P7C8_9BACL|nr:hypothetical protein [Bhargavaea cecembensis]EMR06429.1 hypothetical protein C772_01700 [Bhargavaea cecembensis DSE10]